jgi:metalloendopeptidase OMA1, mitochondrial
MAAIDAKLNGLELGMTMGSLNLVPLGYRQACSGFRSSQAIEPGETGERGRIASEISAQIALGIPGKNLLSHPLMTTHPSWNRRAWIAAAIATPFAVCCGCRTTPVTGRKQLRFIPKSMEMSLGEQSYAEVVSQAKPSENSIWAAAVQRTGSRIAEVANAPDFQWEFRLLASETKNAFCLPGGKVAIYEGIIPSCQNEAGLAVVMSHEIAHALAHHGAERMSQQAGVKGVGSVIGWAMSDSSPATREIAMRAFGTGAQYGVLLPYSRKHESEADEIGLHLLARAGYDPSEAPLFWERFGSAKQGSEAPPEWASTHPSDDRRAADLAAKLPEAMQIYQTSPVQHGQGESFT